MEESEDEDSEDLTPEYFSKPFFDIINMDGNSVLNEDDWSGLFRKFDLDNDRKVNFDEVFYFFDQYEERICD